MIGCDAASSLPWSGSSIAILTVPLEVSPPPADGEAPPADALGAFEAVPPVPHAAKVRTATLASAPTLEILIRSSPPRIDHPVAPGDPGRLTRLPFRARSQAVPAPWLPRVGEALWRPVPTADCGA